MRAILTAALIALALPAWAGGPVVLNPKAAFPEGPAIIDGTLHYVEYGAHRLMAWDGKANRVVWEQPGCGPSAVAPFGADLVITCYDNGSLALVSKAGVTLSAISADAGGGALLGPNDLAADGHGGLYVTASGPWEPAPIVGKVYHLSPDRRLTLVASDLHYANGVVVAGDRLLVNESEAGRVISFQIAADGSLSDRRLFLRVGQADRDAGPWSYPDGIKRAPDGTLYIGLYSAGRIVVVDAAGAYLRAIPVPGAAAAPNLAFAPDGKSIYVMAVDDRDKAPYWGRVLQIPLE